MVHIDANLTLIEENGRKIVDEIADVQMLLNNLYERISNIHLTGEAIGDNVVRYCKVVEQDKKKYMDYTDGIKAIGQNMIKFANDTEDLVRKTERNLGGN